MQETPSPAPTAAPTAARTAAGTGTSAVRTLRHVRTSPGPTVRGLPNSISDAAEYIKANHMLLIKN